MVTIEVRVSECVTKFGDPTKTKSCICFSARVRQHSTRYPPPFATWGPGAGRRKVTLTGYAFRFACCSQNKRSCFCTMTFRSSCWRPQGRRNWIGLSCGLLIDVMEASEHGHCDDLSRLGTSITCKCRRRSGRPLSNRTMRAPVVEIADILGQELPQNGVHCR